MGYELRLYAGELSSYTSQDTGQRFLDCVLSVDLSKPGYNSHVLAITESKAGVPVYFYFPQRVDKDSYDCPVLAYPLKLVVAALEKDNGESDYRRFPTALCCLRGMDNEQYRDVYVAFVGH